MINSDLLHDLCTGKIFPLKYTAVKQNPIIWSPKRPIYYVDVSSMKSVPTTAEGWAELIKGTLITPPDAIFEMKADDEWLDALSGICDDAFELEETTKPGRQIPRIDFDFTVYPDGTVGQQSEAAEKEYPHKCLSCGSKAFIGFSSTDCSNSSCGNYKG